MLSACNSNHSNDQEASIESNTETSVENDPSNDIVEQDTTSNPRVEELIALAQLSCGIRSCPMSRVIVSKEYKLFSQNEKGKSSHIENLDSEQQNEVDRLIKESQIERAVGDIVPGKLGCKKYNSDGDEYEIQYQGRAIKIYDGCQSKPGKMEALFLFLKKKMSKNPVS
jgi:hypothetical protein